MNITERIEMVAGALLGGVATVEVSGRDKRYFATVRVKNPEFKFAGKCTWFEKVFGPSGDGHAETPEKACELLLQELSRNINRKLERHRQEAADLERLLKSCG